MNRLKKAGIIFDHFNNYLVFFGCLIFAAAWFSVCFEIFMRYFLNRPQHWVSDIVMIILLYITFLGAAWLLKREGHIKVDIVLGRLKPRIQALLNIITSIIGTIVCLALSWYGAHVTWDYFQTGVTSIWDTLGLPRYALIVIIPFGSFLLSIQFVRRTYGYLASWRASANKEQGS